MSFWHTTTGKVLRWILFLPVGLVAASVLEVIPIFSYRFASTVELRFTLLTLIIGIVVVSFLFTFVLLWFMGVFFTPTLSCSLIAPTPKVASVIFGTLFVLFQALTLLPMFVTDDTGWGIIIYKILFSLLLIGGVVASYSQADERVSDHAA